MIRFYGIESLEALTKNSTEELIVTTLLSEKLIGPKVYCFFPLGRIEEYIEVSRLIIKLNQKKNQFLCFY
jgi:hypothetical protein